MPKQRRLKLLKRNSLTIWSSTRNSFNPLRAISKWYDEVRLDVARLQFEGNSGSLSSVIDKAAVSATLMSAAAKYESDAQNKRENEQIQMGKTIKTGTNY